MLLQVDGVVPDLLCTASPVESHDSSSQSGRNRLVLWHTEHSSSPLQTRLYDHSFAFFFLSFFFPLSLSRLGSIHTRLLTARTPFSSRSNHAGVHKRCALYHWLFFVVFNDRGRSRQRCGREHPSQGMLGSICPLCVCVWAWCCNPFCFVITAGSSPCESRRQQDPEQYEPEKGRIQHVHGEQQQEVQFPHLAHEIGPK